MGLWSSRLVVIGPILPLLVVAPLLFLACEGHYASAPPVSMESLPPLASSSPIAALLALRADDAGDGIRPRSRNVSLAMAVTRCAPALPGCPTVDGGAGGAAQHGMYRVVANGGRVALRSRDEAKVDLYNELRSRTNAGERLEVATHAATAHDGGASLGGGGVARKAAPLGADPVASCAVDVLQLADELGEATLSVVHGARGRDCLVSLSGPVGDGGAVRCLLDAPDAPAGRRGSP